jgi:hypothetical protein
LLCDSQKKEHILPLALPMAIGRARGIQGKGKLMKMDNYEEKTLQLLELPSFVNVMPQFISDACFQQC